MKKSKKSLNLLWSIVAIAGTVVSFIMLALNWMVLKVTFAGSTTRENYNLPKWFDFLKDMNEATIEISGRTALNVGKVFLIISIVLLALVAICALLNLFIKNKYLALATKIVSVASLISVVVFLIAMIAGCSGLSDQFSSGGASFLMGVGSILFTIFGIATSALGFVSGLKAKK
ncbi:MAG: hypothetical protein ACI4L6_00090 [Candidatus Onthoplasma sp.]